MRRQHLGLIVFPSIDNWSMATCEQVAGRIDMPLVRSPRVPHLQVHQDPCPGLTVDHIHSFEEGRGYAYHHD